MTFLREPPPSDNPQAGATALTYSRSKAKAELRRCLKTRNQVSWGMRNQVLSIVFLLLSTVLVRGQVAFGLEFQAYPTGLIPGVRVAWLSGQHSEWNLRVGGNFFDHQDFGVQEEEIGRGPGGSLGYRYYFRPVGTGLYLGLRTDLWRNANRWRDQIGTPDESSGVSRIWVLQPTLEGGYAFDVGETLSLQPSVSFGREWNVVTEGAEVGQGLILLLGISAMYSPN
ncbi:MAG: hypothetical protein AAF804_13655 [Bacteroidota bacterium]